MALKYQDNDGDFISLSTQNDLDELVDHALSDGNSTVNVRCYAAVGDVQASSTSLGALEGAHDREPSSPVPQDRASNLPPGVATSPVVIGASGDKAPALNHTVNLHPIAPRPVNPVASVSNVNGVGPVVPAHGHGGRSTPILIPEAGSHGAVHGPAHSGVGEAHDGFDSDGAAAGASAMAGAGVGVGAGGTGETDGGSTAAGRRPSRGMSRRGIPPLEPLTARGRSGLIRWQRGEVLGQGAFGKVYMGMNLDTGELMAVKHVDAEVCSEPELVPFPSLVLSLGVGGMEGTCPLAHVLTTRNTHCRTASGVVAGAGSTGE